MSESIKIVLTRALARAQERMKCLKPGDTVPAPSNVYCEHCGRGSIEEPLMMRITSDQGLFLIVCDSCSEPRLTYLDRRPLEFIRFRITSPEEHLD
jgi:hypothetical protein